LVSCVALGIVVVVEYKNPFLRLSIEVG
jgi:hypothetical protein